jgi:hypothetical protein
MESPKMNDSDKKRFLTNVKWFNEFFEDLKSLFEVLGKSLSNEFSVNTTLFYYPKLNFQPTIPPYYMMGMSGEDFAVQVFAVLDPSDLENHPTLKAEPSLVIVKHSRGDRSAYVRDYGLKVIRGKDIEIDQTTEDGIKVFSGIIVANQTKFGAFQLELSKFGAGQDIDKTIREEVSQALNRLPSW